jgi:hypothetical protein
MRKITLLMFFKMNMCSYIPWILRHLCLPASYDLGLHQAKSPQITNKATNTKTSWVYNAHDLVHQRDICRTHNSLVVY